MANENTTSLRSIILDSHLSDKFLISREYNIDPFPYLGLFERTIGSQTLVFGQKKEFTKGGTNGFFGDLLFMIDRTDLTKEEFITEVINHGWVDLVDERLLPLSVPRRKVEIFKKIVMGFNKKLRVALEEAKDDKEPIYEFGGKEIVYREETVRQLFRDFRREAAISSGLNTSYPRYSDYNENPCTVKLQWRQNIEAYLMDPSNPKRNHYYLRAEVDWLNTPSDQRRDGYGVNQCCGSL